MRMDADDRVLEAMRASSPPCGCRGCVEMRDPLILGQQMIVCPICGNKRCPHASHHDNACSGSNEPGQPESVY